MIHSICSWSGTEGHSPCFRFRENLLLVVWVSRAGGHAVPHEYLHVVVAVSTCIENTMQLPSGQLPIILLHLACKSIVGKRYEGIYNSNSVPCPNIYIKLVYPQQRRVKNRGDEQSRKSQTVMNITLSQVIFAHPIPLVAGSY
jgi:hypothetical protein